MKPSRQDQPACPLLPASPLWVLARTQRWGHVPVLAFPAFPITSGALNSCHGPGASPRARPAAGSCSSKAEPQLPVRASPLIPTPEARGDPQTGGFCVPSTRMRAGSSSLDHPSIAHPMADVESRVPQHPVGLVMLSCPGDSPTAAPKTGSPAGPHAVQHVGIWGLSLLTYFPGGAAGLSAGNA